MAPEPDNLVIHDFHGGRLAEMHLVGMLDRDALRAMVSELVRLSQQRQKIRMLLQLHHFTGWQVGHHWPELSPTARAAFLRVERMALVAAPRWQAGHSSFTRLFVHAWRRFFPTEQSTEARAWIDQGLTP